MLSKRQLQSDVGYACYLSGGIDSAIIAYTLSKIFPKKLDTFSVSINKNFYETVNHTGRFCLETAPVPMYLLVS